MNGRSLALGVVTLVVLVAAWKISEDKAPQTEITRSEFLPSLIDRINEVAAVDLRSATHATRLVRDGETWRISNKDDFPADAAHVRRTLLQLAALRGIEAKTRSPERYGRIGVDDIDQEGAEGTRVEVDAGGDEPLVSLIVGNARGDDGSQHYVRRTAEAQSWLVDGALDVPADPIPWLDAGIVDVDTQRVRSVRIEVPGATPVLVTKNEPADNFFTLQDVPAGYAAKSKATVSSVGAVLLDLRLNDVAAASRVTGQAPVRVTTVRTFDGLVATLSDYVINDVTWTAFGFAYDAEGAVAARPAAADDAIPAAPLGEDGNASETSAEGAAADDTASTAQETVTDEVSRLSARTSGWVYALPDYKRRMIERDFDSLVEEKKAEEPAAAAAE
ncbi:MAG: DUF4340 domain-containing protein [Gammaproteobacteria bacterium]